MTAGSEVIVTLSAKLYGHLHGVAADLEVTLEWLVAGLVCDPIKIREIDGLRHDRTLSSQPISWSSRNPWKNSASGLTMPWPRRNSGIRLPQASRNTPRRLAQCSEGGTA
jgi:hypothetical protein